MKPRLKVLLWSAGALIALGAFLGSALLSGAIKFENRAGKTHMVLPLEDAK